MLIDHLGHIPETSITVETRLGHNIENNQSHEFSRSELPQLDQIRTAYRTVTFRTEPNPNYNCHGLSFASRRTGIIDASEVRKILQDDGYSRVPPESVLPGDIVVYIDPNGDLEHSGIVISEPDENIGIPMILSKWGRGFEVCHWVHACPYDANNLEYYRVTRLIHDDL